MPQSIFAVRAAVITAETGSFSETGRRLGVSHSVISKRIGQLEWELRRKLFMRSTRAVQLTEFGAQHLPKLVRIVRDYDDLMAGVNPHGQDISGHLSVKFPTFDSFALPSILEDFIAQHRELTVNAVFTDSMTNPADEGFDVVVTLTSPSFDGVPEIALRPFERVVCASASYVARMGKPEVIQDLARHDCIVFGLVGPQWTLHGPSGVSTIAVNGHLRTNNINFVREMVLRGEGIAVLPKDRVLDDLESGSLIRVLPNYGLAPVWLKALISRQRQNSPAVRALVKHLVTALTPMP